MGGVRGGFLSLGFSVEGWQEDGDRSCAGLSARSWPRGLGGFVSPIGRVSKRCGFTSDVCYVMQVGNSWKRSLGPGGKEEGIRRTSSEAVGTIRLDNVNQELHDRTPMFDKNWYRIRAPNV